MTPTPGPAAGTERGDDAGGSRLDGAGGRIRAAIGGVRPSLSRLAAASALLAFLATLLGVWTAVGSYGLTCEARWPLCDGGVFGLLPANFSSFVEWFHRLVAMLAGWAILGTAATAWYERGDEPSGSGGSGARRARLAFTVALVLTPLQVVLGALTVTQYELVILATHFATALCILTLLIAGALWHTRVRVPVVETAGFAAAALAASVALAPRLLVGGHTALMHVAYVGLAVLGYAALLAVAVSPSVRFRAVRALAGGGATLVAVGTVLGRVRLDPLARLVVVGCLLGALILGLAAAWLVRSDALEPERVGPAEF